MGLLERNGTSICIHGWTRWQSPKDKTNAQRQARFRAKPQKVSLDSSKTEKKERERETIGRNDRYCPVTASVTGSNSVTEVDARAPISLRSRGEKDQADFDAALDLLRRSDQTAGIADELEADADLPVTREIVGWKWLHAARLVAGGQRKRTYSMLFGIANTCTQQEAESYGKAASGGNGRPTKRAVAGGKNQPHEFTEEEKSQLGPTPEVLKRPKDEVIAEAWAKIQEREKHEKL